jgi:hypothetical protein
MNTSFWKKTPGLVRVLLVFFVSYIVLSSVFLVSTPRITGWMLPLYTYIIEHAYPENKLISIENRGESIMYRMEIHKYIQGLDLPLIETMVDSMHSSFQFVTLVIYYSLLFAWPSLTARKKVIAALISLPVLILFVLVDVPVTVISSIDLAVLQKLRGIPLAESFPRRIILFLSHFINNGGRQFFAVMIFILSVTPFRYGMLSRTPVAAGNGKKIKKGKES